MEEARPPPPYDAAHQPPVRAVHHEIPHPSPPTPSLPAHEKSSLDLTQRLERKLAEYNASENAFKRWLFEILSWATSAICMGAIVAIYIWLKDKRMSEAGEFLTLTNILGKIASAALIVPTTEAIGQLKWNWFQASRAMWDFEIFDKASRGPLGAILLLFRTKGRSLAALGAILIVLLLAIDTFFQQVVSMPDRWTLQSIAGTIPRVVAFAPKNTLSFQFGGEIMSQDGPISSIVGEFLYGNGTQPVPFGNGTRPDIPLSCPTSNCTWPPYETMAICSSCSDVSQILNATYACRNMTIEWSAAWYGPLKTVPYPNGTVCGHFINATSNTPTLLSGYVLPENGNATSGEALVVRAIPLTDFDTKEPTYGNGSIRFKHIRYPILDALISSAKDGVDSVYRKEPPIVHECMLAWCVYTLQSSYAWGIYHEEILSTYFEPVLESDSWPWRTTQSQWGPWYDYTEDILLAPQNRQIRSPDLVVDNIYQTDNVSHSKIMNIFDEFFPSFWTAANISTDPVLRHRNFANGPTVRQMDWNPWQHPNNITRYMERLAAAISNNIRSSRKYVMLEGKAYQTEPYILIRWEWLTFPLTLLLLSLVFLVSTIVKTSNDGATGVWKTSAMPTLIYSLPKETQSQFVSSSTWGRAEGVPRKTRIRMLPNLGWRVSGQNQLRRSPRLPSGERVPNGWV